MKRYWVFAWDAYYPYGGLNDLQVVTDDLDEAKKELARKTKDSRKEEVDFNNGEDDRDYGYILDAQEMLFLDVLEGSVEFGALIDLKQIPA